VLGAFVNDVEELSGNTVSELDERPESDV